MYKFVGEQSGKIYVEGKTKADCFRFLHEKYPSIVESEHENRKEKVIHNLYPERLIIQGRGYKDVHFT